VAHEISWTEPATADLRDIVASLRERSEQSADTIGREIVQHVEMLRDFPRIGPLYRRGRRGQVREILCRNYRIFYRVQDSPDVVYILRVWHASRMEPPLP
jgi:addiction module RelE/StbE family toxin